MNALKHLFFISFIFLLITGCKKKNADAGSIDSGNLEGSYQWEYSINQTGNTSHNLPDHYGVVITKNGQFDYYQNDQLMFSDHIENIADLNGEISFSLQNKTEISGSLTESSLKIVSTNAQTKVPYANYLKYQYYNGNIVGTTTMVVSNIYTKK